MLKFPQKLWRIVNECNTGAIQWGIYGKTILIDYNLFQAQYLECEIPKFKTRNMTSFVRQLNMYGFKKMQTQVKNDSSRCCNIHEFFHNCFRFGRSDLLDNVKRRPTPLKNTRVVQNLEYHNQSRLHLCRVGDRGYHTMPMFFVHVTRHFLPLTLQKPCSYLRAESATGPVPASDRPNQLKFEFLLFSGGIRESLAKV